MNNFTKTEALPKSGHVNEVCKEWLVREDGALAYKLQSQEINHFYKGNRFRNAVVREDFPVALHEQIKEKENAEKQSEYYRRKLIEQEEHDKRIAKEIASKLERDLEEQQQRELQESEMIAQQMQEIYVNLPPPTQVTSRDQLKPPPRPAKSSYLQQTSNEATTSVAAAVATTSSSSSSSSSRHHQQQHQRPPLTTQHFNNNITNSCLHSSHHNAAHVLVSDEFAAVIPPQQPPFTNQFVDRSNQSGRPHPALTTDNFPQLQQQYQNQQQLMAQLNQQRHHHHQHQHHHNSSAASNSLSSTSSSGSSRRNVLESLASCAPIALNSLNSPQSPLSPTYAPASLTPSTPTNNSSSTTTINSNIPPPLPLSKPQPKPLTPEVEELVEYSDVADRLRRYDILPDSLNSPQILSKHSPTQTTNAQQQHAQAQPKHSPPPLPPPALLTQQSPTHLKSNFNKLLSPSSENLLRADHKFQKLSPEKYDQLVGNDLLGNNGSGSMAADAAERHMQQHANDIELYVDPCDYASLKEIGLPMEEIKEMSKKIKQEQKDELLARRLQDLEANNDGLSQEERDRMLAIEAQDKELARMLQEREKAKAKRAKEKARARKSQQRENGTGNGLHCGPLLPLPQDCMSSTSSKHSKHSMHSTNNHDEMLDMEAYSNPIDVINQQKLQNGGSISQNGGSINGGSLTRHDQQQTANGRYDTEHLHEDDIYTLPVDNCRAGQRPSSLNIMPETGHVSPHNSMTRSENYSLDSHESQNSHHDISPRMNYNKTGGSFDQNSSPTPPYMPIQGTRRSNSSEERKKKSKDKCTHQ